MREPRVTIIGATSHLAKGLISSFLGSGNTCLDLYSRSPDRLRRFIEEIGVTDEGCVIHEGYSDFSDSAFDVIINCIGVGTLRKLDGDYSRFFMVTEAYDNMVIGQLKAKCPDALYISFSSGAVYGGDFSQPADEATVNRIQVNNVVPEDYYSIARLNAEAKHRSLTELSIVDLRVFAYFSRFIDLADGYFIAEALNCILAKKTFFTSNDDFVRDYLHPKDMCSAVLKCIAAGKINVALDACSSKPVRKQEILEFLSQEYGLDYQTRESGDHPSATGTKSCYCSMYAGAADIGYTAKFSSMDAIRDEARSILRP